MFMLHRTTRIASCCCCAAVLAGCAKKDNAAVDSTSAMASSTTSSTSTTSTTPAPIKASDVAGVWNVRAVPASGDTTAASTYVLTATSNTTGWTVTFPGFPPTQGKVTIDGDSIVIARGPFTNPKRKDVPITSKYVMRLLGGNLVGTNTAHFKLKTQDSVAVWNTVGTRAK